MTGEVVQALIEYGLPTALLAVMVYLFIRTIDRHRDERSEWRQDMRGMTEQQHTVQKETNDVIRQLTSVIERINHK